MKNTNYNNKCHLALTVYCLCSIQQSTHTTHNKRRTSTSKQTNSLPRKTLASPMKKNAIPFLLSTS